MGSEEQDYHRATHWAITILVGTLGISYIVSFVLNKFKVTVLPEAGASIIIGLIIGGIIRAAGGHGENDLEKMTHFSDSFFFLVLLPPIIFEAGYNMQRRNFFTNIGTVCLLAFGGTLISTFVTGAIMHAAGKAAGIFEMSMQNAMLFGSLISATDPVTVLAIFSKVKVDKILHTLVFGESVFNDAVAIVLYQTIAEFGGSEDVGAGIGNFFKVFIGSLGIGLLMGVLSALTFKYMVFEEGEHLTMQISLLVVFPYMAWMMSEAEYLSGIVSILFCGIAMAHYTQKNVPKDAVQFSKTFFTTLASLAEAFVFVYVGVSMSTMRLREKGAAGFIVVSILVILFTRAIFVFPLCGLANFLRKRAVSLKSMCMLWCSGLRGAIAFALAARTLEKAVEGGHTEDFEAAEVMFAATGFIVLFTVIVSGGAMGAIAKREAENSDPLAEHDRAAQGAASGGDQPAVDAASPTQLSNWKQGQRVHMLLQIDKRFIIPLLVRDGQRGKYSLEEHAQAAGSSNSEPQEEPQTDAKDIEMPTASVNVVESSPAAVETTGADV